MGKMRNAVATQVNRWTSLRRDH